MSKLIKCNSCRKEVADSAKKCPNCGAKIKKPIYKRVWFLIIIILVIIGLAAGENNDTSKSTNKNNNNKTQTTKKY